MTSEARAILDRDGWRCTATVEPRMFKNSRGTFTIPSEPRRCAVVGSEMVVVDGRTFCPRHASRPVPPSEEGPAARRGGKR